MRIAVANIKNYKKIREVTIEPPADAAIIQIAGKNGQGKSSILDAIRRATHGKRAQAADPVRHGAKDSEIMLRMDSGMEVDVVILPDGSARLEVRTPEGSAIKSPQDALDRIFGAVFVDPLEFLRASDAEQRASLLALIDRAGEIKRLDERADRIYKLRTETGRDQKKAKGELARIPESVVVEPIDVAELARERAAFADQQRAGDGLGHAAAVLQTAAETAEMSADAAHRLVGELEAQLERAREKAAAAEAELQSKRQAKAEAEARVAEAGRRWAETAERRAQVDADLARAGEHNRLAVEASVARDRRAAAAAAVKALDERSAEQTAQLEKIDREKAKILSKAKLPAAGLGVGADGLTLDGVPFAQASAARRMTVALAVSIASSPDFDDVLIRDAAILDEESLEGIAEMARRTGKRIWVERIVAEPGAIVIHDGRVVEEMDGDPA